MQSITRLGFKSTSSNILFNRNIYGLRLSKSKPPEIILKKNTNSPKCFIIREFHLSSKNLKDIKQTNYSNLKLMDKFKIEDGMSDKYTLIYRATFHNYFIIVQFTLLASMIAACVGVLSLIFQNIVEEVKVEEEEKEKKLKENPSVLTMSETEQLKRLTDKEVDMKPSLKELHIIEMNELYGFMACSFALFVILFLKLRQTPLRIYTSKKGHSVAVHYGSLIPTWKTYHEFFAGTLKSVKTFDGKFSGSVFRDGSGNKMVLYTHYFRRPGDLNRLMGIEKDMEDEDVPSHLK